MELKNFGKMENRMNPCNNCIVDMICTQKCPNFKVDLKRLDSDDELYLQRCMSNCPHTIHWSGKSKVITFTFT